MREGTGIFANWSAAAALLTAVLCSFCLSAYGQVFEASNVYDEPYDFLHPEEITEANGKIYFAGEPSYQIGQEPYVSDGTRAGTFRLKDIRVSNAGSSRPNTFTKVGSKVYFYATSETYGRELWLTDGTTAGTRLAVDVRPGPPGAINFYDYDDHVITEYDGKALFLADDGLEGLELWSTDGTPGGTIRLTNIDSRPGEDSHFGTDFYVFNNICYFEAGDDNSDGELWRTDGTPGGTYEVKDMRSNGGGSPERFVELAGVLYFRGRGNDHSSWDLWRTNGTTAGTYLVKNTNFRSNSRIQWMCKMGNYLYFTSEDFGNAGREIWRSDGTEAGTVLLKDIRAGRDGSNPEYLTVVGDTLYFVADDGQSLKQLWKTNGNIGNATKVFNPSLYYGSNHTDPQRLVNFKDTLFFKMRYDDPSGPNYAYEWFYLDSSGQLQSPGDINPGGYSGVQDGSSDYRGVAITANAMFFNANDARGYPNYELWRISEVMNITQQPASQVLHAGQNYTMSFAADQAVTSAQWYKDGSPIPGATVTSYQLVAPQGDAAGFYNASGSNSTSAATTLAAQIAILESSDRPVGMKVGARLVLSVKAYGENIQYQWMRGSSILTNNIGSTSGAQSPTFTINSFAADQVGNYYCKVSIPGATRNSRVQNVALVTQPVVSNTPPPASIVSGDFMWQLAASQAPSKFLVRGLPPGLRYDPKTGEITGSPTVKGSFKIRVIAYNIVGRSEQETFTLTVGDLPANLAGSYFGEIDRDPDLNFDLGGTINAKVAGSGVLSGNLNLGGKRVRFKGRLLASGSGDSTATIEIPVRRQAPYLLTFVFDRALQEMDGTITRNSAVATYRADRDSWDRENPNTTFSGRFNSGLDLDNALNGNLTYPQGHGYMMMTVAQSGKVRIAGRAGDGARFTMGSLASRLGEVSIFALMHRRHASLHGYQTITRYGVAPEYLDSQVIGTLSWLKKPNSKRSGSVYPGGFPQAAVATAGGEWTAPAKGELMFDVPEQTTENARFLIRYGTMPSVNPRFVLTPQHRAVFDKATNTYRMSAGFNPRTGLFRGRFYKTDNHPLRPGATIRRAAAFSGVVVPQRNLGYGQFLISELPDAPGVKPEKVTGAITLGEL